MRLLFCALALAVLAGLPGFALAGVTQHQAAMQDGTLVDYKVLLPGAYDGHSPLPALLAFPGGRQTIDRLDTGLQRFWGAEAEKRGFLVILPAAPAGVLFFRGGEKIFPEFLDAMLANHNIKDGKFHLAGVSNGGRSAFHVAARHPGYFTSILAIPGFLPDPTPEKYAALDGLCIVMIAGEKDLRWIEAESRAEAALREAGGNPLRLVSPGDGHLPLLGYSGDNAGKLFDFIESGAGC
jgi:poly(3-hydroxybutyrate) depolymerase